MRTHLVVLDDVRAKRTLVYENPVEIIAAQHWQDIEPTLQAMQAARAAGRHLAGYFSYELGYGLEARLAARQRKRASVPLLWFGVFESAPRVLEGDEIDALLGSTRAYAGVARFEWNEADYRLRCDAVLDYIARGDIFQANLSFRAGFPVVGSARALYRDLRRKIDVPHAAYIDDGERDILSFSPELFFALRADGSILAQPMKGTAARGSDVEHDAHLRRALQDSIKNRAENLMIVDLMRNDLGRIAQIGSVDVARMFDVDTYSTLHQMTSTVTAHLRDDTSIDDVVRGLFPAGSITGAPKVRAMEIIADLEASPRGVYCGAIGHFCPDGSARFNVAIRTLTICDGRGELGCGGAVVSDSDVADEYAECLLKARYFTALRRPLRLIETLRCEAGVLIRWDLHRARLLR
ncbi:MAG: aminodeoxychorismate synthase component I, partial [Proteobacteria bacterium]|nr:aminodeoxychorismate synthase component I [Pseudomonadota bacterium]